MVALLDKTEARAVKGILKKIADTYPQVCARVSVCLTDL